MNRPPIPALALSALLVAGAVPAADPAPPAGPDEIFCPAIDPPFEDSGPAASDLPDSLLARFADADRLARAGCAPKPLLRAWHDARERLAPFLEEPDPARLSIAAEQARQLPVATRRADAATRVAPTTTDDDWTSIGPRDQGGRMRAIVFDPRDENVLYSAAAGGGVWKTTDAGATWTPLTDRLDSLSSGALALDPLNPDIVWYGSGEGTYNLDSIPGTGIYRSTDAGTSWKKAGAISTAPTRISNMATLAVDATKVYVFAATNKGVYRSTDNGSTWSRVMKGDATDVAIEAGSATNVWAAAGAIGGSADNGVWRSTDGGANFKKLAGGLPATGCGRIELGLSPSPTFATTAYVACHDPQSSQSLGIWKTTDAATFTKLTSAPQYCSAQCWYNNVLQVDPANPDIVFAGGLDVYRSGDGGNAWSKKSDWAANSTSTRYVHADQHAMTMSPTGVLWIACDGGVFRSTDSGTTFEDRSSGLVTAQYYSAAQHPTEATPVIGGLQDNGTQRYQGDPSNWREVYGGDGGYTAIDPVTPNLAYTEYVFLDIHKSTNGGSSFSFGSATSGIPQAERESRALFIAPFAHDPARTNRLLAGTNKAYFSQNGATNWQAASDDLTLSERAAISALAFDPLDQNAGWVGTEGGHVWLNTTLGAVGTWVRTSASATAPLPAGYVKRIAVDPTNSSVVWVAFSGTSGDPVYRSTDRGGTWASASSNLPKIPTNGLAIDSANSQRVWVGNDLGVYYTENAGASWARYGSALPNVRVDELIFHAPLRRLRAATHGRGVWEVSADLVLAEPPVAAFDVAPASPTVGQVVTFTDRSTGGAPSSWAWNFGDGSSTTVQNPTHAFAAAGVYSVTLTATNGSGTSSASKSITVTAPQPTWVTQLTVPGQARAAGAGSHFKSSLWISSPVPGARTIRLRYVPQGDAGGAAATKEVALASGGSASWADVLGSAFGATGNTSGAILVETLAGEPVPVVSARTYNDTANGTYGQYIPAVAVGGTATPQSFFGLGGDAENRTNIGIANLSYAAITATITVLDDAGVATGTVITRNIAGWSSVQVSSASISSLPVYGATVSATGPFFAYASKLNNKTSDPIFIPGTLAAKSMQWIDGVAAAAGAGGTFFRSSLVLANPGSSSTTAFLAFTKKGETAPAGSPVTVTLAAGETATWSDLVTELFGLASVSGYLTIESAAPIAAWARTYNDQGLVDGVPKSFGQFIPGFGSADLIPATGAAFLGVSASTAFRTNFGLVNTGTAEATVTLTVLDGIGAVVASKSYALAGGSSLQKNVTDVVGTATTVTDGSIRMQASSGAKVYGWASIVDNTSTDQTFVRPMPLP